MAMMGSMATVMQMRPFDMEIGFNDEPAKPVKPAPPKFDPEPLEALIIKKQTKDEIISVLKQASNAKKIFEDWGLGETIEYGKGMTFLFWGKPGTGKTWGATLIAKCFKKELLTISMAEIQSSEPGAANRNIQEAFKTAKEEQRPLFIDECDSLIYDRQHLGMILAGEVNTLLTEIEKFEGILILATNQVDRMDAALERRISLIVEFEMPDFEQRQEIWRKLLPKKMPLHADVLVEDLAAHPFTGGFIKNVILHAARAAAAAETSHVLPEHFAAGIVRVKSSNGLMGNGGQKAIMRQDAGMGTGYTKTRSAHADLDVKIDAANIDSFFDSMKPNK